MASTTHGGGYEFSHHSMSPAASGLSAWFGRLGRRANEGLDSQRRREVDGVARSQAGGGVEEPLFAGQRQVVAGLGLDDGDAVRDEAIEPR